MLLTAASRARAAAPILHRRAAMSSARTALDEMATGKFVRRDSAWRRSSGDPEFPPEAGRYHLYVAMACPWANRCLAVLNLKGIPRSCIGVSIVHPTWQRTRPDDDGDEHCGWVFRSPGDAPLSSSTGYGSFHCDGCVPDPHNRAKTVRELYELAGDTEGKYSVPVLWDTKTKTIVNNESAEIIRMLNDKFDAYAERAACNLFPSDLEAEMKTVDEWIYSNINNGVYRCGFARSQAAYDEAAAALFAALDRCEAILGQQRYIAGDRFTASDVRLFMTLIRFDEVYVCYFKTNMRFIHQYKMLAAYTREVYQMLGIKESIDMDGIKTHYFTSHPLLNHYAIIPRGPCVDLDEPHGRDRAFPAKT